MTTGPDLNEAKLRGREAGRLHLNLDLCPYPADSLEALTWRTERILTIADQTLAAAEKIERSTEGAAKS